MADYFKFQFGSPYFHGKLTPEETAAVTTWQTRLDYDFSFHTMHEAGWPVYIVEGGQHGQRNRPKINVKDKTSVQAVILASENWNDREVLADARRIMVANWALFQKLAQIFYEGTTTAAVVKPKFAAEYKCDTPNCRGRLVTQEISSLTALANPFLQQKAKAALGKCKICRTINWTFVRTRALVPPERPDIDINQQTAVTQV